MWIKYDSLSAILPHKVIEKDVPLQGMTIDIVNYFTNF